MERIENGLLSNPTGEQFEALIKAYNYFNLQLFGGILPGCIITFSKKRNSKSFMMPQYWRSSDSAQPTIHQISLTATCLNLPPLHAFVRLIHEMVHLWQWEYGTPSRAGYHNKEWANKMQELGLMSSNTGAEGGKSVGQKMKEYIIPNGRYQTAFGKMPKECLLPFIISLSLPITKDTDKIKLLPRVKSKTKYSCSCGTNIWGKPNLSVICGKCNEYLVQIEQSKFL
jgi:predicted SprT family Zn-dependent metalloprotease